MQNGNGFSASHSSFSIRKFIKKQTSIKYACVSSDKVYDENSAIIYIIDQNSLARGLIFGGEKQKKTFSDLFHFGWSTTPRVSTTPSRKTIDHHLFHHDHATYSSTLTTSPSTQNPFMAVHQRSRSVPIHTSPPLSPNF